MGCNAVWGRDITLCVGNVFYMLHENEIIWICTWHHIFTSFLVRRQINRRRRIVLTISALEILSRGGIETEQRQRTGSFLRRVKSWKKNRRKDEGLRRGTEK